MFTLPIGMATRLLEKLGKQLQGDYEVGYEEGILKLDNDSGEGRIRAFNLPERLSTLIFDVTFHRDITFKLTGEESQPLFFLFCLEGHFFVRRENKVEKTCVSNLQNVIVSGDPENRTIIYIPSETSLKISVIWLHRAHIHEKNGRMAPRSLQKLARKLKDVGPNASYFGGLRPRTAEQVRLLIENTKPGGVGRLLTEAAILNILASQLDHYRRQDAGEGSIPLTQKEIQRVLGLGLGEDIVAHLDRRYTVKGLSRKARMNTKKLQAGFQHLYGCSVSNFIRDARLERARELIQSQGYNVSEAVYAVGLSSRSYFSKAFTARYGMRPSEVTANYRAER